MNGKFNSKSLHILILAAILALFARVSVAAEPLRLLVLGDSLSAAYGMPVQDAWVALLAQRLDAIRREDRSEGESEKWPGVEVINASISGETTAGGLERLPGLLAKHRPRLVIIALGANDGLRGFAPRDIGERLVQLIDRAEASGASVLLVGIRLPPNYGAAYSEGFQRMFADVAEQTGVQLVPRLLAGVAERWDLMQADGLHPTAAAQARILDNLWPALREMLHAPGN
ncbi:arylesterase [Thiorhodovibrio winogradskyi]|nr:arylesterase [Thiorhodovibrio winogradskyi]